MARNPPPLKHRKTPREPARSERGGGVLESRPRLGDAWTLDLFLISSLLEKKNLLFLKSDKFGVRSLALSFFPDLETLPSSPAAWGGGRNLRSSLQIEGGARQVEGVLFLVKTGATICPGCPAPDN